MEDLISLFETWLRDEQDRSALTIKAYLADLRAFVAWKNEQAGETFQLADVTPTDIKDYRAYLTGRKHKASSINRTLAALRAFFKWAMTQGNLTRNPMTGVKTLRRQEAAPRWLDPRAEHRLQQAIEQRQDKRAARDVAMLTLMWKAGLRVSEIAALDVSDILVQSGKRGVVHVRQGKGRKSRDVPLNADAAQAVRDWLVARPRGSGPLFLNKSEQRLTPRAIQQLVGQTGRTAAALVKVRSTNDREMAESLSSLSPHVLRHTCAKRMLDAGAALTEVAEILGHENLNTTWRYTQPGQADLQRAVDRISTLEL